VSNLQHSIFQTEVQFNAPIISGHASGMIGHQSSHPQGNPALADTWIIEENQWNEDAVRAGPAMYQPCAACDPPIPDWRIKTNSGSNLGTLASAKQYIEGRGFDWIDIKSPAITTTTTSGRSSGSKKSKPKKRTGKSKKKRSWRSRLKALRRRFKW